MSIRRHAKRVALRCVTRRRLNEEARYSLAWIFGRGAVSDNYGLAA